MKLKMGLHFESYETSEVLSLENIMTRFLNLCTNGESANGGSRRKRFLIETTKIPSFYCPWIGSGDKIRLHLWRSYAQTPYRLRKIEEPRNLEWMVWIVLSYKAKQKSSCSFCCILGLNYYHTHNHPWIQVLNKGEIVLANSKVMMGRKV